MSLGLLNNPWIIGIGSSIVSSLIVYFVTSSLLSRKQNREYLQKIRTANNELLYLIRPLIAQKQIPSNLIVESLIKSTARKYEVSSDDLLSPSLLADDLIREVMENPFLESDLKVEYCNKIKELTKVRETVETRSFDKIIYRKDRTTQQYISVLLAAIAAFTALAFTFSSLSKGITIVGGTSIDLPKSLFVSLIIPLLPLIFVTFGLRLFIDKIERNKKEFRSFFESEEKNKDE